MPGVMHTHPRNIDITNHALIKNNKIDSNSDSHLSKKNCVICFIESLLKMMKNAFYFILKALFVLKIFKFLSWLFGHVGKTAWLENKVNFKIHDVTTWLTNNYNTHVAQYLTM